MTAQPSQPVGETTEALVERMRARANESEKGVDFVEGDDAELADDMLQDVALFRAAADGLARLAEVEAQRDEWAEHFSEWPSAAEARAAVVKLAEDVSDADLSAQLWRDATEIQKDRAEASKRQVAALEAEREKLVTLVRVGFLVTVNGERATADTVANPEVRETLFSILQAKDTAAALASLAAQDSGGPSAWLIHYEDADRDVEIFTGEGAETAARSRYDESCQSWNCTLFAAQDSGGDTETADWRCECGDLNRWHELFCYRCGAGPPDEDDEPPAPSSLAEREEKR